MKYRNIPEVVEAFQFTPDAEIVAPEWFQSKVAVDDIIIDRALVDGAAKVVGCTIYEKNARMKAKNGDYIVRWKNGKITAEQSRDFHRRFVEERNES